MLKIENVSKSYDGKKKAIDNINLTIKPGDIYGFIGHNGAGKTTLLKAIAGIHSFDEGNIIIHDFSIKKKPLEAKKIMAYIPDNPDIYESLTGRQYLDFIADVFDIDLNKRNRLIGEYSSMFEMESVLNDPISSYSHGMKQKIVIMGALIHEPKVMLLDEPFVGLDPKASFLLKEVFNKMCEKGSMIFFSTHVLEVAEKLCNKVAIIKNGKIVTNGLTKDIIEDESLEHLFMELLKES
ncbi:MAG: ABC transporter ATP-binding protein [Tenericutes bacterium]|jgi:ABC-2 type transport system ATP-binding protein|nr:ABC transporter ATP-binding protein [Mycoplasmatota bacterium]